MIAFRDELLARAVTTLETEGAAAIHLFGSLARGDGDVLSDIDLWATVPDAEIERVIERRFEIFDAVAEIVIHHEAPRNRPLGGSYTLVIHRVGDALIQADYYFAPESTSVVLPEAKRLGGQRSLPRGRWALDSTAEAVEDLRERIDFLVCMSFIGVKKVLRRDRAFVEFLEREFERFAVESLPISPPPGAAVDLDLIAGRLRALESVASDRQCAAIAAILEHVRAHR